MLLRACDVLSAEAVCAGSGERAGGAENQECRPVAAPSPPSESGFRRQPRPAAALLLFAGALFAGLTPGVAHAQDSEFVSNHGQTDAPTASVGPDDSGIWRAQSFTTGGNSGGYNLSSVDVDLYAAGTGLNVTINASTMEGVPGTVVHSLTSPTMLSTGINTFTAQSGATLAANTTYFVVFSGVASGTARSNLWSTLSDSEDSGSASGWSIGDAPYWRRLDLEGYEDWQISTQSRAIQIAIRGTVVSDTTAPTLRWAWVDGATLTLTYDEALDTASVPASSAFTVKVNGFGVSLAMSNAVAIAGNAVTLTLASVVPAGASVTLDYDAPTTNPIRDAASNNAANLRDQPVTMPGIVLSSASLELAEGASGTYTVALNTQPSGNVTVTVARAAGGSGDVTFDTSTAFGVQTQLTFNAANWFVPQAVMVSAETDTDAVLDRATLTNTASGGGYAGYTASLGVTVIDDEDTTAPALAATDPATVNGASLVLTYDEALDPNSVPAATVFAVVTTDNFVFSVSHVTVIRSTVTLTLHRALTPDETVTVSYTAPATNPIRDAAGNKAANFRGQAVTMTDTPAPLPSLSAAVVNGATLALTYDQTLDTSSVPAASAFTVQVAGSEVVLAETNPVSISGSAVTLTLALPVTPGQTVTVTYRVPESNPIQDEEGDDALALDNRGVTNATPGILLSATTLSVDEGSSGTYTARLSSQPSADVTVTVAPASGGSDDVSFDTSANTGVQTTLTFTTMNWDTPQTVTVTANTDIDADADTATLVHTAAGGGYDGLTANLAVAVRDPQATAAPALAATNPATVNGASLVLTYDETLDPDSVPATTVFAVVTTDSFVFSVTHVTVIGSTVTLTLHRAVTPDETVTVSYTAPASNPIQDAAGNQAANFAGQAVTMTDAPAPAPSLSTAVVNGATLALTYAQALDTSSVPAANAFSVRVAGSEVALAGTDPVSISGSAVTLTLASPVKVGDAVTVNYRVPASNPIQDEDGNDALGLDSRAVTNATPGILLSATTLLVDEGASSSYTARLNSEPSGAVTVTVAPAPGGSDDVSFDTSANTGVQTTLTFTGGASGNWDTPQTVTVSAIADTDMVPDTATLVHTAAGGGYDGLTANLAVAVRDTQDTTAPTLTAATVDTRTVVLTYDEPLDPASVPAFVAGPGAAFTPRVFRAGSGLEITVAFLSWAVSGRTVRLTLGQPVNDDDVVTVSYTAPPANPIQDPAGNGAGDFDRQPVTNATPERGIVLSPPTLLVPEGGSRTYQVRLNTEPADDVTVTVAHVGGGSDDVTFDTSAAAGAQTTLTFTEINWHVPQTVRVSAAPDADADADTATLVHRASDGGTHGGGDYDGFTANLAVTVSDAQDMTAPALAGATVNHDTLVLTYDELLDPDSVPATGAFTVRVAGSNVSVAKVAVDGAAVKLMLAAAAAFGDAVTVSYLAPATSPIQDGTGNDAGSLSQQQVVNNTPERGIVLSDGALLVNEGASRTYTVRLNAPPSADVTVTVVRDSGGSADVTFDTSTATGVQNTLTFTTMNWNTGQPVTVSALRDADTDTDTATLTHTAAGGGYDAYSASLRVEVVEDHLGPHTTGITVNGDTLVITYHEPLDTTGSVPGVDAFRVTEDGSVKALTAVAVAETTVTLLLAEAVQAGAEVHVRYNRGATPPLQDEAGNEARGPGAGGGSERATNNTPGILLRQTRSPHLRQGPLYVAEGGSGSYLVRLSTQPTGEVTVTVARAAGGSDDVTFDTSTATGVQNTLTFTTTNWDTGQTVTVTAATDTDMNHDSATLTHSASGGGYAGYSAGLAVAVTDANDMTAPALSTAEVNAQGRVVLTYNELLDTASVPAVSAFAVTVDGVSTPVTHVEVNDGDAVWLSLGFFVVRAGDTVTVSYTAPATNPIQDVAGNEAGNLDRQAVATPGIVLSRRVPGASGHVLDVLEGTSAKYTVRLATQPSSEVKVTLAVNGSEYITVDQGTLTFTTANWNAWQTVTVTAAEDSDSLDDSATVIHLAAGGGYDAYSVDLGVRSVDPENQAELALNPPSVNGAALTLAYSQVLDRGSVPAAGDFAVTVDGTPAALANLDPVVVGINGDVRLTLASPVPAGATVKVSYTAGTNPIRSVAGHAAPNLVDEAVVNNTPGVLLSASELTLTEGGSGSYTVRLAAPPSESVTVAITSSNAEVTVDDTGGATPNTLTFTTGDWSTARTVTVRAAEDDDAEADSATLTHEIGGASEYDRLADPTLAVTVNDNESANNAPEFASDTATRSFDENTAPDTDIGEPLAATDVDETDTLTYSLGGTDAASFDIDSGSGQLRTKSAVTYDFEAKSSYTVTVQVSDETDTDTVTVTITLNDVNEPPAFTTTTTAFEVPENTTVVGSAEAADPDADDATVTYVLGGTDSALFSISAAGVIAFDAAPDFETPGCGTAPGSNTCTLTVTASAGADTRAMSTPVRTITVTVTDVGPPAKPAAPTFGDTTSTTIVVNWLAPASPGSAITDYDVQYREGTTGGWTPHTHDGTALTATLTSLNAGASYQVQVRATNGEGQSGWSDPGTATASDNNAPAFDAESYAFELEENADGGTDAVDVGTVSATDPDGHTVSYEIADGDDGGVFAIASDGAITYTGGGEDHETTPSFTLTVRATDTHNGSDDVEATVSVTDVNEPPVFDTEGLTVDASGTVMFSAAEDADAVGTLTAADPDAADTVVTYVLDGTDASLFGISDSGVITFQATLNFDDPRCGESSDSNECTFSVVASAGVGPRAMSATVGVEVTVLDSDDMTAPALSTPPPSVNGATLTLTYDEALDRRSVPGADAFTVEVDGSEVGLATGRPVAVSGSAVTLTLASAVTAGQAVTLDYAPPANNAIQDRVGNDAGSLMDQPVTNVTPGMVLSRRAADGGGGRQRGLHGAVEHAAERRRHRLDRERQRGRDGRRHRQRQRGRAERPDVHHDELERAADGDRACGRGRRHGERHRDPEPHGVGRRLLHRRSSGDGERRGGYHRPRSEHGDAAIGERRDADADLRRTARYGLGARAERVHGGGGRQRSRAGDWRRGRHRRQRGDPDAGLGGGPGGHGDAGLPCAHRHEREADPGPCGEQRRRPQRPGGDQRHGRVAPVGDLPGPGRGRFWHLHGGVGGRAERAT